MPLATSESAALIHMIERAARDPAVDIEKMERLFRMHGEVTLRAAKVAYASALAEMQPELPIVGRKGRIEIRAKTSSGERDGRIQQATPYALWEDINEAIRPSLAKHGFALSFRTGQTAEGKITVTGILCHREGHSEETTITLMHDSTGSKNSVQAVGSSISYGKRYTAIMLLNITTRGEDDDGKAAGAGPTISDEQVQDLNNLLTETKSNTETFLTIAGVASIPEIPAAQYEPLRRMLEQKKAAKR